MNLNPNKKHKFSLLLNMFGWVSIVLGIVFLFMVFLKIEMMYIAFAISFSGVTFFIADYIIQILFEIRNNLQELMVHRNISTPEKNLNIGVKGAHTVSDLMGESKANDNSNYKSDSIPKNSTNTKKSDDANYLKNVCASIILILLAVVVVYIIFRFG